MAEESEWDRAKKLLLGAVDVMQQLKDKRGSSEDKGSSSKRGNPDLSNQAHGQTHGTVASKKPPSVYEEHRHLFGYQPSKACTYKRAKNTSKGKGKKRKAVSTWTKEVICLKDSEQSMSPTTEEKIELAQMNLGLRKLVFSAKGDSSHIHQVITDAFPILDECGGYTLMRVADNSRELVAIEGPDGGVTVTFLKDILRQAKLYIRPLQCDVPEDKLKKLNEEAKDVCEHSACTYVFTVINMIMFFSFFFVDELCCGTDGFLPGL